MKRALALILLLALPVASSEPSKAELELKNRLRTLRKNLDRDELAARRKFLDDAKKHRPSLSRGDQARLDAVVLQVELEVGQAELRKWIIGTWTCRGTEWVMNEDGTAAINESKMYWRVVGEAVVVEEKDWKSGRMWMIIEMVGPDSASGRTRDAESFVAERKKAEPTPAKTP